MNAPIPNSYSPQNAAELCAWAGKAYDLGPFSSDHAMPRIIQSFATDTECFTVDLGDDIVVAFRGTTDLRNWMTDFDAILVGYGSGMKVHRGFNDALYSVAWEIESVLLALENEGKKIWLTGHSLGGALAMLFGYCLAIGSLINPKRIGGVYTFGQPRIGNAAFRDSYNALLKDRTWRVVNAVDLVPHVPWLCGAYRHAGHEVFYDPPVSPVIDAPAWLYAARDVTAMVSEFIQPTLAERWIADHAVAQYQALFSRLATGVQS